MAPDRLDALLRRFSVTAHMFHAGALCGVNDFAQQAGLGQLHLVRRGPVEVRHAGAAPLLVQEPSVLFYPRPLAHRFDTDPQRGADMACAHVRFNAGSAHPLAAALPAFVCLPLQTLPDSAPLLEALFDEAFQPRCGRQAVVDRLFEVVLIRILRVLMDAGRIETGLLAGLAHAQLARALVAVHERPAQPWTLATLALEAGQSRSAFAAAFRAVLDCTPGDYLTRWRVALAQDALRRGRPLKVIAQEVGYGSEAALSRAFKASCGQSPSEWRRQRQLSDGAELAEAVRFELTDGSPHRRFSRPVP
jgi:AraC-like DNA-binding protein